MQICRALAYIHGGIGVCHRDIKPQNLLVHIQILAFIQFYDWMLFANKICCCRLIPTHIKWSSVILEVQKFWYGLLDQLMSIFFNSFHLWIWQDSGLFLFLWFFFFRLKLSFESWNVKMCIEQWLWLHNYFRLIFLHLS